ncbi:HTH-type transcriptional repressor Bm3R1 [bacterium HR28]|nr:HTH-type transcriptional repressor Bm3R1 [bacterium HR28]
MMYDVTERMLFVSRVTMSRTRTRTEERVLQAAKRLFLRFGFDKTTMDDVAREAGVAKGTLYRYWPSKEALFESLLFRELRAVNEDFLTRIESDPAGGTIGRILYHGFAATYERPFLRALMTTDSRVLGTYLRQRSPELSRWQFRLDRQLVEELQEAGVLRRDLDPHLLTYLFTVISLGLSTAAEVVAPELAPPTASLTTALADMAQRAFAPEGGGDSERGKEVLRRFITALNQSLANLERETRIGSASEGDKT